MTSFAIPVAVFEADIEVASGRPLGYTERAVLRSIGAGHVEFAAICADLALHPRLLSECLTTLFEAGIIEFAESLGGFDITPLGYEALTDPDFLPATLEPRVSARKVIVDRVNGLMSLGELRYEKTSDIEARNIRMLQVGDIDPMPARSVVRRLIARRLPSGLWVRSVGPIRELSRYGNAVVVHLENGHIDGLPSREWRRAFAAEIGPLRGDEAVPAWIDSEIPWNSVPRSQVRAVAGADDHASVLEEIFEQATSYVFVHSAFLTGSRAKAVATPIVAALNRGIDVIVARGGSDELTQADEDGRVVFSKIAYDCRQTEGRFFFAPNPTGSHCKIVVRDGKEVLVGSFNWLSANPDSTRPELSLRVEDAGVTAAACELAADLFGERPPYWPAQVLRSGSEPGAQPTPDENHIRVRVLADVHNRELMFRYLSEARDRLDIWSDKVTTKADPLLREKLLRAAHNLAEHSKLHLHYNAVDGEHAEILEGLEAAGAVLAPDGTNHIKALICDNRYALVTSYNLLSLGGGVGRTAIKEIGLELHTTDPQALQELVPGSMFSN